MSFNLDRLITIYQQGDFGTVVSLMTSGIAPSFVRYARAGLKLHLGIRNVSEQSVVDVTAGTYFCRYSLPDGGIGCPDY
jgi:hypothetical protein